MQESEGVNGWRISSSLSCEYVTRKSTHTAKIFCNKEAGREIERLCYPLLWIGLLSYLAICSNFEVSFSKIRITAIAVKQWFKHQSFDVGATDTHCSQP